METNHVCIAPMPPQNSKPLLFSQAQQKRGNHKSRKLTAADRVQKANEHHRQYQASMRGALEHAKKAGYELLAAKRLLNHGDWTEWLEEHFEASVETARVYMRISNRWKKLEYWLKDNPTVGIEKALKLLVVKRRRAPADDWPDFTEHCEIRLFAPIKHMIKNLSPNVRIYLGLCDYPWGYVFHELLKTFQSAIEKEVGPIADPIVEAAGQRLKAIQELPNNGVVDVFRYTPKREAIENVYNEQIRSAFKDVQNLTELQRRAIFSHLGTCELPSKDPELFRRYLANDNEAISEIQEYNRRVRERARLAGEEFERNNKRIRDREARIGDVWG
jgi:hypothetical protein